MMLGQFWLSMRTSFVAVTKPVCLLGQWSKHACVVPHRRQIKGPRGIADSLW